MKIYLIRHGESVNSEPDNNRFLSKTGQNEIELIAKLLKNLKVEVSHVFCSEKLRTQQTAQIISETIQFSGQIESREELSPLASISPIASEINQSNSSLMYIGHMPFMGKLLGKLLVDNANQDVAFFYTGSTVCLERVENTEWIINWAIYPKLLDPSLAISE